MGLVFLVSGLASIFRLSGIFWDRLSGRLGRLGGRLRLRLGGRLILGLYVII